jgi:hypothetical protein
MADAAWACEASCSANDPVPDLQEGLGELEIKPETLRFGVCTTRDFVADSSINVENWVLTKASAGFRRTTSNATAWSLHNALCYPQLSARLVDCGQDT